MSQYLMVGNVIRTHDGVYVGELMAYDAVLMNQALVSANKAESLIAENERLSAECEGCPMAEAEKLSSENVQLREERDSQQRVCIQAMEENRKLNGTLDAICAALPVEYLGPANGGMNALAGDFARMAKDAERYLFLRRRTITERQDGIPFIAIWEVGVSHWTHEFADQKID